MTPYIVLTTADDDSRWSELGRVEAANDLDAIRKALGGLDGEGEGSSYVAIPARSFRVRRPVTKTIVSFAEVAA